MNDECDEIMIWDCEWLVVHCVTVNLASTIFKEFLRKSYERDPLWDPNVLSPSWTTRSVFKTKRCVVSFPDESCVQREEFLGGHESGRRGCDGFFGTQALGVNTHDASTPWSQWWSHVVGVFPQYSVTPTGLLMIHLEVVWLDLPMVWWVLLCAPRRPTRFLWVRYRIAFRIES